ncbi:unnamed protein product [Phytomonas sp. EM1]|nr:unnamed protein product [Phytomonas sp. EM1]|eukprot:CCW62125.1 unnamed protein product [Phytomonas sp. isolate EM1]
MGLSSAVFFLLGLAAHVSVPSRLPLSLKFLSPSIGWLFTSAILRRISPLLYSLILGIQGLATFWWYFKFGESNTPFLRMLACPFISTILGGLTSMAYYVPKNRLGITLLMIYQFRSVLGGLIMLVVFPASTIQFLVSQKNRETIYDNTYSHLVNQLNKRVDRIKIPSEDGESLDTVIVRQPYDTSRWIMYFGGNAEFLESSLFENSAFADQIRANLILFNARGVGRSSGCVSQLSDLVKDSLTVARHVVKRERILPSNLVLFGHSIGGALAAEVAACGFPTSILVLDRSFSNFYDAAALFSPFTPAVTKFILFHCIGELNTIRSWNFIQHNRKLMLYARKDEIIPYQTASIARLLQFQPDGQDSKYALELHGDKILSWHNSPLFAFSEKDAVVAYLNRCFTSE